MLTLLLIQVIFAAIVIFASLGIINVSAQTSDPGNFDYFNSPTSVALALSAAIAVSSAVIGSGIALKTVGTAAISSLSDNDENFFKAFLIVALCEALAVYGLIVAIQLWTKIPYP